MTATSPDAARGAAHITSAESVIMAWHAELQEVLDGWAGTLAAVAAAGTPARPARKLLSAFLADEVLSHAKAEERTLYPAGARNPRTRLLVQALVSEHRALAWRAARLREETEPVALAAAAEAIRTLFASHVAKENYLLLPALTASGADLRAFLAREDHLAGPQ